MRLCVTVAVVTATTQGPRLYTRPALPSPDALDRLKLTLAWHTRVLTYGHGDVVWTQEHLWLSMGWG